MRTLITVVRGKDVLLKDASLQIVPRGGESLKIGEWRCKVLKVEHTFSTNPDAHSIHIFAR